MNDGTSGSSGGSAYGPLRAPGLVALAALTLFALALRLAGLDHLLPQRPEMDAQLVDQTRALVDRGGWGPEEVGLNDYPTLVARVAALVPLEGSVGSAEEPASLARHLAAASSYHLRVRLVVCLCSTALIPLAFLLARRFTSAGGALMAATLVAIDPVHVLFSSQARPHGVLTTLMLIAVLGAMRLARRPTPASYVLAGVAAGLALGALHSGLAALLPLGCAFLVRARAPGSAAPRWFFASLSIVGACFALFYSDMLRGLALPPAVGADEDEFVQGGHRITLSMFDGGGFAAMARILVGANPVLALLSLGGLVMLAARFRRGARAPLSGDARVALSFALPYFLVLGIYGRTPERFLLPLLPYFALLAALVCQRAADALRTRLGARTARPILAAGGLALFALPASTSAKIAWLRTRPDTYEQLVAALSANLPTHGVPMLAPGVDLPVFYSAASLEPTEDGRPIRATLWPKYQLGTPPAHRVGTELPFLLLGYHRRDRTYLDLQNTRRMLRQSPASLVVVEVSGTHRDRADGRNLQAAVEEFGRLALRFRPDAADDAHDRRLHYVFCPNFLRRILTADALGPELRVYLRRVPLGGS